MAKKTLAEVQKKFHDKVQGAKAKRGHHGHKGTIDPAVLKAAFDDIKENVAAGDPNAPADEVKAAVNDVLKHSDDIISVLTD